MPNINLLQNKAAYQPIDSDLTTSHIPVVLNDSTEITVQGIINNTIQHSNNPVIIGLGSKDLGTNPLKHLSTIAILSTLPILEFDTLTLNNDVLGRIIITAKNNPIFKEFKAGSTTTLSDRIVIVESIVSTLNEIPVFKDNYIAYHNNTDVVKIKALYSGTKYDVLYSIGGNIQATSTLVTVVTGQNKYRGENYPIYSLFADLYVNAGGDFGNDASISRTSAVRLFNYEKVLNLDNFHPIDLSSVLNSVVNSSLPPIVQILGSGDYINIYSDSTAISNYFIVYGEAKTESITGVKNKTISGVSKIYWVLNSSTDYLNSNYISDLEPYIIGTSTGGSPIIGKFLTLQPKYKQVDVNSNTEWLSFLFKRTANIGSTGSIRFGLRVIYYHKTTKTTTTRVFRDVLPNTTTSKNINVGGCHYFNVSPKQLLIDSVGGVDDVDFYLVSLIYSNSGVTDTEVTPPVYYKVYNHNYQNCKTTPTTLVFETSLGRYESILFAGKEERSFNREISKSFRPVGFFPSESDKVNYLVDNTVSQVHTISTGLIDNTQKEYYLDLLKSTSVYVSTNNKLEYIIIEDSNWNIDNYTGLSSLSIRYRKTVSLNNTNNR